MVIFIRHRGGLFDQIPADEQVIAAHIQMHCRLRPASLLFTIERLPGVYCLSERLPL
ncbi:MAG: hypothetical protein HZC28_18485 [Spirochaetes bacterium]|nr:hypothetical protein [Spirochaetota bacterium]